MGGSDNDDNYSKRVQFFSKYQTFVEKPPMISKRAFFPSLYCSLDHSIFAFGGNDSSQDLNHCEKYSLQESVWRPIAPMIVQRNGAGATLFEQHRLMFVFGGNNQKQGSLSKIEKYNIDFDKWTLISVSLRVAIHDPCLLNVGRERVLVFGGHTNTEPYREV